MLIVSDVPSAEQRAAILRALAVEVARRGLDPDALDRLTADDWLLLRSRIARATANVCSSDARVSVLGDVLGPLPSR